MATLNVPVVQNMMLKVTFPIAVVCIKMCTATRAGGKWEHHKHKLSTKYILEDHIESLSVIL
jgi:hypothetical protein